MIQEKMKSIALGLTLLLLALAFCLPAGACVGKTLIIGSKGSVRQEVLAHMLAILIGERTGTTVKVEAFDSTEAVHGALLKADLDMYVEYAAVGHIEILGGEAIADAALLYEEVKKKYNRDLNLVWLKPLGFSEPGLAQAAPVVRKDTLKKFPALSRLINKLGGAVDGAAILALEEEARKKGAPDAARAFLKAGRLI